MKPTCVVMAVAAALLTGCAASPSVKYHYHLTNWETTITVTQTLGCSAAGDYLVSLSDPAVETKYFADTNQAHDGTIELKNINSRTADSNFKIDYMSDGRLQGINSTTTGQGGAILKAAITAAATLSQVPFELNFNLPPGVIKGAPAPAKQPKGQLAICQMVTNLGNSKPISIVYKYVLNADKLDAHGPITFEPDAESDPLYREVITAGAIPSFTLSLSDTKPDGAGGSWDSTPEQMRRSPQTLKVQDMGIVTLTIAERGGDKKKPDKSAIVLIPRQTTHDLPIPKARLFGSQTFTVAMDDSGRVKSSGYQHTTGVAGVVDAIQEAADTQTPESKAAALKAQSDLIVQQHRRIVCITDPTNCK